MYGPALFFACALAAAPLYKTPGYNSMSTDIPTDARLKEGAAWAINQKQIPSVLKVRWQLNSLGISLSDINVYYQSAAAKQEDIIRELQTALPERGQRPPITIQGSACKHQGGINTCALIVASGELLHEPFAMQIAAGKPFSMRFYLPKGFKKQEIWLIAPSGKIAQKSLIHTGGDTYIANLPLTTGRYQVEIMATGPKGPKVLLNVPIFVNIPVTNTAPAWLGQANLPPTGDEEEKLLYLINMSRRALGLKDLKYNAKAAKVARIRAMELAKSGELSHTSARGTPADLLQEEGAVFGSMAENIAHAADILSAHYLLMTSPLHRYAILNPLYTQAGMGIAHRPGARGSEIFVAQEFIQPLPESQTEAQQK